jgi:hypothetical protein
MRTLEFEPLAKKVSFDAHHMWVELIDGRKLGVPLAYFPRLAQAKPAQRRQYVISGGGIGLHWEALDEDISVPGLMAGRVDATARTGQRSRRVA